MNTGPIIRAGILCAMLAGCSNDSADSDPAAHTFSDPDRWDELFMLGAVSTEQCEADTIENAERRMSVAGPYSVEEFEMTETWRGTSEQSPTLANKVSRIVRDRFTAEDGIYSFLLFDHSDTGRRGVTGYLVARGECIVYVDVTGSVF